MTNSIEKINYKILNCVTNNVFMCIYVTSVDIKKREFLMYENYEAISMMIWYMNYNLCETNNRVTSLAPCVRIVNNHTTLLVVMRVNCYLYN